MVPQEKVHNSSSILNTRMLFNLNATTKQSIRKKAQPRLTAPKEAKARKPLRVTDNILTKIDPIQHVLLVLSSVRNNDPAPVEDSFRCLEDLRKRLRAVPRPDVFVRYTELEALRRRPMLDVGWIVDESVVDDCAVDVDNADAADAAVAPADVLHQVHAFAVDGDGRAGSDEVEERSALFGAADVLFLATVGAGFRFGFCFRLVGIGLCGDCRAPLVQEIWSADIVVTGMMAFDRSILKRPGD